MLEPLRFFLERRNLLFRLRPLAAQQRNQMLFARVRRGDRLLPLLNDLTRLDDFLTALRHLRVSLTKLLPLGIEMRDRARVARCEIGQHRHRFDRIAAFVDRKQKAHVTQTAQPVKGHEAAAQKIALPRQMLHDRIDLRLQIALLPLEICLHAHRDLDFARADIELNADFFQLLLRRLRLRADLFESTSKLDDVRTNAIEIRVLILWHRHSCLCEEERRQECLRHKEANGPCSRVAHAWPRSAAPPFSMSLRRARDDFRLSPRR